MSDAIKVDVLDLLAVLEIENVREIGRGEVEFSCPRTDGHAFGDFHPSAHMNKETGLFRCKACHWQGNAFDFVIGIKRCSQIEALRFLRERYGQDYREPEGGAVALERQKIEAEWAARTQVVKPRLPAEWEWLGPQGAFHIDWRDPAHPAALYMRERGFAPEVLEDWQLGFDSWTDRITIPVRDEHGVLVGFKGRTWQPDVRPKYLILGDTADRRPRYGVGYGFGLYEPAEHVFALDRVIPRKTGRVVGVEGELNVIALHSYGVPDAIGFGMSWFSDAQLRLVRWYADQLVSFLDSDDAGERATWGYEDEKGKEHPGLVERLLAFMDVRVVPPHDGDPASMERETALDLIARAEKWSSRLAAVQQ